MMKVGFIGAGTVGTALAVRLYRAGCAVVSVSSRSPHSAHKLAELVSNCEVYQNGQGVADTAELVFITTPDDVIAKVVGEIGWHAGQDAIHCSGAHSIDILEPARQSGANVGSFHPLQTFASYEQAMENLPGSAFALEAEEPLLTKLKQLAHILGGSYIELKPGDKVLYHAAAVFASNYLVALVKLAVDLWQYFGVSPEEALKALMPLLKGTISNIESIGLPRCLTGPVARGDLSTISKHLSGLKARDSGLLTTYRELGLQTIPIALAKGGIDARRATMLEALLKQ
jgi:predicted short-subunit dehydrogenase-like oxidoreductase (DUF2520 family)